MKTTGSNKMWMALLSVAMFTLVITFLGEALFHIEHPEKPGYELEGSDMADQSAQSGAEPASAVSIASLMASADAAAGENSAKKCAACHSFEQGGANKVGPNLWNIVGHDVAAHEGFAYSDALLAKEGSWTYEELNGFLTAPKKWVDGTAMAFAGIKKDQERANIIAYLRSLSDAPQPLPVEEQPAASAPEAGAVQPVENNSATQAAPVQETQPAPQPQAETSPSEGGNAQPQTEQPQAPASTTPPAGSAY